MSNPAQAMLFPELEEPKAQKSTRGKETPEKPATAATALVEPECVPVEACITTGWNKAGQENPAAETELEIEAQPLEILEVGNIIVEPTRNSGIPAQAEDFRKSPRSFNSQLSEVKRNQEDHEWYPTTNEILDKLVDDMPLGIHKIEEHRHRMRQLRFLDIGAGNGKVLDRVRETGLCGQLHAVEKSSTLLNLLPADVFVLGVDFWKTSLVDKETDVIFSNPPYSEYEPWVEKIMTEAPAGTLVYLVIPERWKNSETLKQVFKSREVKPVIISSHSFQSSEDRAARANIDLLRIHIPHFSRNAEDPFLQFFEKTFQYPEPDPETEGNNQFEKQIEETKIVRRVNFIEALCILYEDRMTLLQKNYQAVCSLEYSLLKEFEITKEHLVESLRMKLSTAKQEFWKRLFSGMNEITSRLTSKARKRMLDLMQSRTGIDFNRENAYAIVMWVVKNANAYFDEQLVEVYENLCEAANVENYKSNQRVFKAEKFRYLYTLKEEHSHYRLKVGHRI